MYDVARAFSQTVIFSPISARLKKVKNTARTSSQPTITYETEENSRIPPIHITNFQTNHPRSNPKQLTKKRHQRTSANAHAPSYYILNCKHNAPRPLKIKAESRKRTLLPSSFGFISLQHSPHGQAALL